MFLFPRHKSGISDTAMTLVRVFRLGCVSSQGTCCDFMWNGCERWNKHTASAGCLFFFFLCVHLSSHFVCVRVKMSPVQVNAMSVMLNYLQKSTAAFVTSSYGCIVHARRGAYKTETGLSGCLFSIDFSL